MHKMIHYDWNDLVCTNATIKGHFDVLKWARAQNPPCVWDGDVCRMFVGKESLLMILN